ncbi:MAG TPA: LUD domain-containing protein, partial [Nitriliruptorales bacterium]
MTTDLLTGTTLRQRARNGIADEHVRGALRNVTNRLADMRVQAQDSLTNWEELRDGARAMRGDIIARLPEILERLADNVEANGGTVFWAADADEASGYVAGVARRQGVELVVKSKSMVTEEIHLNDVLQRQGIEVVETDLGEWIIQLAQQMPSHILAPAIHMTRGDIADLFNRIAGGDLSDVPEELTAFAREQLRDKFLIADLGISGCNFGVAETGSMVLVTNEGNGRMVTSIPRTHIAMMGMERVVETWEQLDLMMNLL